MDERMTPGMLPYGMRGSVQVEHVYDVEYAIPVPSYLFLSSSLHTRLSLLSKSAMKFILETPL